MGFSVGWHFLSGFGFRIASIWVFDAMIPQHDFSNSRRAAWLLDFVFVLRLSSLVQRSLATWSYSGRTWLPLLPSDSALYHYRHASPAMFDSATQSPCVNNNFRSVAAHFKESCQSSILRTPRHYHRHDVSDPQGFMHFSHTRLARRIFRDPNQNSRGEVPRFGKKVSCKKQACGAVSDRIQQGRASPEASGSPTVGLFRRLQ